MEKEKSPTAINSSFSIPTCPICFDTLAEPYLTKCGHSFCYSCMEYYFGFEDISTVQPFLHRRSRRKDSKSMTVKKCPVCSAEIQIGDIQPVPTQGNVISSPQCATDRKRLRSNNSNNSQSQALRIDDALLLEFLKASRKKRRQQFEKIQVGLGLLERDIDILEHSHKASSLLDPPSISRMRRRTTRRPDAVAKNSDDSATESDTRSDNEGDGESDSQIDPYYLPNPSHAIVDVLRRYRLLSQNFEDFEDAYFDFHLTDNICLDSELQSEQLEAFRTQSSKALQYIDLQEVGTLHYADSDLLTSIVSAVELDISEKQLAMAGVTKKIKIYDVERVLEDARAGLTLHYPSIDILASNKISSLNWSAFTKNYLLSADYEGLISLWDTGRVGPISPIFTFDEHEKRVWSVHCSQNDQRHFVSGSDDCKVKIWSLSNRRAEMTLDARSNVCCVQYHPTDSYGVAFGAADHSIHYYDLRMPRYPLLFFTGHRKAVSYIRFLSSTELVSASTDSTLRLWDLNLPVTNSNNTGLGHPSQEHQSQQQSQSSPNSFLAGDDYMSGFLQTTSHVEERRQFTGHVNERNFVGLAVRSTIHPSGPYNHYNSALSNRTLNAADCIACGSENNAVYIYDKHLRKPLLEYRFDQSIPSIGVSVSDQLRSNFPWSLAGPTPGLSSISPPYQNPFPPYYMLNPTQKLILNQSLWPLQPSRLMAMRNIGYSATSEPSNTTTSTIRTMLQGDMDPLSVNPLWQSLAAAAVAASDPPPPGPNFISSLTFRQSSGHLLAANSQGLLKILEFKSTL